MPLARPCTAPQEIHSQASRLAASSVGYTTPTKKKKRLLPPAHKRGGRYKPIVISPSPPKQHATAQQRHTPKRNRTSKRSVELNDDARVNLLTAFQAHAMKVAESTRAISLKRETAISRESRKVCRGTKFIELATRHKHLNSRAVRLEKIQIPSEKAAPDRWADNEYRSDQ